MKKTIFHNYFRNHQWESVSIILNVLLLLAVLVLVWAYNIPSVGDTDHKWSWGENIGWQNWASSHGGVTVTGEGLTGYVWAESVGWIKLGNDSGPPYANSSSTDWGVINTDTGRLSGYAWGENVGWINFNPEHSQVKIDQSGHFSGYAWGENIGWINFEHTETTYIVWTTWTARPPIYTLATTTGKTINIHNNLTIGDGTNKVTVAASTTNPILDIDGNFTINTTSTFVAPTSSLFTIAGNWTNNGTFTHASGTVAFDGPANSTSTISDSNAFYNLNCTTSDKNIVFEEGATTTVAGTLTLTGTSSHEIILRSSSSTAWWYLTAQATTTVSYVNVQDSNASSSATAINDVPGGIDSGNNPNWLFPEAGISITGKAYTNDDEGTAVTSTSICVVVNNGAPTCEDTDASGVFEMSDISTNSSDQLTFFIDGGTIFGNTVTVSDGNNIVEGDNLRVYQNHLIVRYETGTSINITQMDAYDDDQNNTDMLFDAEEATPNTLSVDADTELYIWTGKNFAPGGNVTLDAGGSGDEWDGSLKICSTSTFTGSGTSTYSIGGSWIASSTATFTAASSTVTFTSTAGSKTITTAGDSFYNLTFNGSSGGWTFQDNATSTNNFTISDGTITGPSSGIIAIQNNWLNDGGTFTHDNSTVLFYATDSGNTITSGSSVFYNLEFDGSNGEWFYKDGANGINQTTVKAGTPTFLNTKPGTVSVTGGTLNVDWYLGVHVVDANSTSTDVPNATTTISSTSTSDNTIWMWSGSGWGDASTSQVTVTYATGTATGTIPQPGTDGAIRIREYSATSTGNTYYKYNLAITANGFSDYNYFSKREGKYISSTSSSDGDVDKCISESWQRNNIDANNTQQILNEPPTTGTWYAGMDSDLEFGVDSFSVNLGSLDLSNSFTNTATTITYVTTTAGYLIQAYASDDGQLTATSGPFIIRWDHNNGIPVLWGAESYCKDNEDYCGFGYTTNDNPLTGDNRFGNATNYAGFTSSPEPVADRVIGNWTGEPDTITYKVSVSATQQIEEYNTTITYVCTARY